MGMWEENIDQVLRFYVASARNIRSRCKGLGPFALTWKDRYRLFFQRSISA